MDILGKTDEKAGWYMRVLKTYAMTAWNNMIVDENIVVVTGIVFLRALVTK